MTPPFHPSPQAMTWRNKLRESVKRNRIRLSLLLALLLAFGGIVTIPAGNSLLAWAVLAPFALPLYLFVNAYRQENRLTWLQAVRRITALCVVFVLAILILVGLAEWIEQAKPYWHVVLSVLLVVGLYAAYLGLGLLVLYLAVRVVRAAWKRPMADSPVTRQELESAIEEILEKRRSSNEDDLDDDIHV